MSLDEFSISVFGVQARAGDKVLLDSVNLAVEPSTVLSVIGPNGSGKTTLLKAIGGIPIPGVSVEGQIRIGRIPFSTLSTRDRAKKVTYVPPEVRIEFPITAMEAVGLGRICHQKSFLGSLSVEDEENIIWAMEQTRCWALRDRTYQSLSGGEKQLVALARALAQGAKVLLLDEALSKMDLHHQSHTGELIRSLTENEYTIILVSHDLNLASEWADQCLLMKAGEVLTVGKTVEVITEENILKLYPKAKLKVLPSPASGVPKVFFAR